MGRKRRKPAPRRKGRPYSGSLRFACVFLVLSALVLVTAWWRKEELPSGTLILSGLQQDPLQKNTREASFEFDYLGKRYHITPVAEYEIWGLLVTHNNPQGFADIYHDATAVDLRDFCLVWGDNVENELYRDLTFWSNTWTCHMQAKTPQAYQRFNPEQMSNNHLLAGSDAVRDTIFKARIGDQVHLRGMLVNYESVTEPGLTRKTSTVRSDTGNGACEVLFVEEARILHPGNPLWNGVFTGAQYSCALFGLLVPLFFCLSAYGEQRRINISIAEGEERLRKRGRAGTV